MAEKSEVLNILLQEGVIDEDFYETLVEEANRRGVSPVTVLLSETPLGQDQKKILAVIARDRRDTFVDLVEEEVDPEALQLLKYDQAQAVPAIPLRIQEGALVVAVPLLKAKDPKLRSDFAQITRMPIRFVAATTADIRDAINRAYRSDREMAELTAMASAEAVAAEAAPLLAEEVGEDNEVVQYVNLVLEQALRDGASDIHFNPTEHGLRVLYRIDGVLYVKSFAPVTIMREITSRVKVLASLDPANRLVPQDGRISTVILRRKIDFRVATLPTQWGEKIVMRVLDNTVARLPLASLGFSEHNLEAFRKIIHRPHGMLLVTGPTGSGKSTTLYSALNEIVDDSINIVTVEDPIEYSIENITQVEVKEKQLLTFARALRTTLRADPDVILVGEIRDGETASIAMQAGMTGHMVFSTLHTNSAASALTRLVDLGVQPYMVASTLVGVASQRLIRKLCSNCKESYTLEEVDAKSARYPWDPQQPPVLYRQHEGGCRECSKTGYRGRVAIHEVLPVTKEIERAIVRGAQELEIAEMANKSGMVSMRTDGFEKVGAGVTSLAEVLRATEERDE